MLKYSQRILFSLLSVLLVCLSCFSSLTINAFAEESEADSYNIDCVPYSQYISNLTVKDNETQVVMRSTYALSATSSTSDASTDYLYSYSDYLSLFKNKSWWSPYYNNPVFYQLVNSNGKNGVKLLLGGDSSSTAHTAYRDLDFLKTGNKYSFSFTLVQSALTTGTMSVYLCDSADETKSLYLYSYTASVSGQYLKVNKTISGNVIIPEDWTSVVRLRFRISNMNGAQPTIYINDFSMTDITNENLDKSLGKLGDRIEGFFDNLADKIKGFFIPSDGFFDTVQEHFQTLLSEHLGFLYEAPALVGDVFEIVGNWEPSETPSIVLPAFNFTIADTQVHLWDEQTYTFDFLNESPWSIIYGAYKTFIFVILCVAIINLAISKYHSIVGGD